MRKEKKSFNWAKYENGGDNETRKLTELLKSVIWQLSDPYRMKRRGKRKALLSAQGDGSTGGHDVQDGFKRAGICELVKNEDVIRRIAKYLR